MTISEDYHSGKILNRKETKPKPLQLTTTYNELLKMCLKLSSPIDFAFELQKNSERKHRYHSRFSK